MIGAHFTHTVVMRYHNLATGKTQSAVPTSTIYETADESKEGMNLLTLIAELFNAQVISAKLIYDLVRGFLEAPAPEGEVMGEIEVERLLRILKCTCITSLVRRLTAERRERKLIKQVVALNSVQKTRLVSRTLSISFKTGQRARKRP